MYSEDIYKRHLENKVVYWKKTTQLLELKYILCDLPLTPRK